VLIEFQRNLSIGRLHRLSRVKGEFPVMSTVTADARFLRRVLAFLIVATLASGAVMAYAAASLG
jgi:hypothetical protein